jgi:Exosome complex component RRP40, S1 domain
VIGVVTARAGGGEAYRVDIGSAHPAQLDGLAFEGATKRNRPVLKVKITLLQTENIIDNELTRRLGRWYTHGYHWPIKIWSLNSSASTHRLENLRALASSRVDSWSNAA